MVLVSSLVFQVFELVGGIIGIGITITGKLPAGMVYARGAVPMLVFCGIIW